MNTTREYSRIIKFLASDKGMHFCAGAVLAVAVAGVCAVFRLPTSTTFFICSGGMLAVGVAKEAKDFLMNKAAQADDAVPPHTVDLYDAIATGAGGVYVGAVFVVAQAVSRL